MSNLVVVQLTDDIQHVQLTNDMIQRSFDRYEIESDEKNFKMITQLTFKDHLMNQSLAFKDLIDMKLKAMKNFKMITQLTFKDQLAT